MIAPEANQGDIMGDLNSKRGRIQGVGRDRAAARWRSWRSCRRRRCCATSIDLRSITGGRGRFSLQHSHYDPVPAHLVDKLRAQAEPVKV